jgi:acyl-CoA thioesterase
LAPILRAAREDALKVLSLERVIWSAVGGGVVVGTAVAAGHHGVPPASQLWRLGAFLEPDAVVVADDPSVHVAGLYAAP